MMECDHYLAGGISELLFDEELTREALCLCLS
jgi:hypothetical protein